MTVSAPVSPASPQTLFCQDSSTTELLISKLTELTALPQTLRPPRVRAVSRSKLGTPTSCNSQGLDIVRASGWVSLSVSFPLRLQQGPAGSRTGPQLKEASFQHVLCHPLGVGHERIQWCPGSHSFHRAEGADIAYAYSARAKPSHSSYLSQRGLGKCNLTMCLWDTTPGVFVEGVNDFCNLLSIVKRKTGSSFGH